MKKYIYLLILVLIITGCSQVPNENISSDTTPPLNISSEPEPSLSESDFEITNVDVLYTWVYRSQEKNLDIQLFTEEFQFFTEQERPSRVNTSYANQLVNHEWQEDTIQEIVQQLESYGDSDDETVRVALQFVRSIPFNRTLEHWTYPYETLYLDSGVCADKTFLAAAIVEEMGYSVAIMGFVDEDHMVLGIGCDEEYAYWEEFCFVDVTDGHSYVTEKEGEYGPYSMPLPDQPDYAWVISQTDKVFDAEWDNERYLELVEIEDSIESLDSWLEEHLTILNDANQELMEYKEYIENTAFSSREEWEEITADYDDFLNDYNLGVADYNSKVQEYEMALNKYKSYRNAYGLQ